MASDQEMWALAREQLTSAQYEALWMRVRCEFTVGQIAEAYGISRQAVDARLAGARRRLEQIPDLQRKAA